MILSRFFSFLFCLLLFTGCRTVEVDFETAQSDLDIVWKEALLPTSVDAVEVVGWSDALELLYKNNANLRKQAVLLERAERRVGQVYRDLLPAPFITLRIRENIDQLDDLASDSLNFNASTYLRLSGLFTLPQDLYAANLMYLRSCLMYEASRRDATVELWVLMHTAAILESAVIESGRMRAFMNHFGQEIDNSIELLLDASERQILDGRQRVQSELRELLQVECVELRVQADGLPDFEAIGGFGFELDEAGALVRKLAAVELLGADARIRGAQLNYWPRFSFSIYGGDLFRYVNGEESYLEPDDLFFTAGLNYTVDFSGRRSAQVQDAKVDAEFLEERIALDLNQLGADLLERKAALKLAYEEKLELIQRLEALQAIFDLLPGRGKLSGLSDYCRYSLELYQEQLAIVEQQGYLLMYHERFWDDEL